MLAVLLHYESSLLLSRFLTRTRVPPRPRMLVLMFGLLAAHMAEIWLFALGAWLLLGVPGVGELTGHSGAIGLPDVVYVSATTYTTLGYGDLVPVGHLRFLFGMEALAGLMLITWSASLGFLEMQRHWRDDHAPGGGEAPPEGGDRAARRDGRAPRPGGAAAPGADRAPEQGASASGRGRGRAAAASRATAAGDAAAAQAGRRVSTAPLRVLLVDDESLARLRLARLVAECPSPRCEVVGEAANATQALVWLAGHRCDVLLADIAMPGRDGLQLAAEVARLPDAPAVVFVTAHAGHALAAFDLAAVDYLTKPVRRERLHAALQRAAARRPAAAAMPARPRRRRACARPRRAARGRGAGPAGGRAGARRARGRPDAAHSAAEVLYLKAELKYVTLRTARATHLLDDALADLEQRLGSRFLRVHRNALVARDAIRALERRAVQGAGHAGRGTAARPRPAPACAGLPVAPAPRPGAGGGRRRRRRGLGSARPSCRRMAGGVAPAGWRRCARRCEGGAATC